MALLLSIPGGTKFPLRTTNFKKIFKLKNIQDKKKFKQLLLVHP